MLYNYKNTSTALKQYLYWSCCQFIIAHVPSDPSEPTQCFWFITLRRAASNLSFCQNWISVKIKASWSSNTVNCIIIPSHINFFNQAPFGYLFQCFKRIATPINGPTFGGITTHSCSGRRPLRSGSQFAPSLFVFCNYHSIKGKPLVIILGARWNQSLRVNINRGYFFF